MPFDNKIVYIPKEEQKQSFLNDSNLALFIIIIATVYLIVLLFYYYKQRNDDNYTRYGD